MLNIPMIIHHFQMVLPRNLVGKREQKPLRNLNKMKKTKKHLMIIRATIGESGLRKHFPKPRQKTRLTIITITARLLGPC